VAAAEKALDARRALRGVLRDGPLAREHPDLERLQQRTVRVLVAAQVLGGAAIGVGASVSPLLAKEILGGDDTLAGVAFAALTFGSALAALPLSRQMSRHGRRPGLVRGYVTAMTGAGAAVIAAEVESFPLLLAGMVLMGSGTAANLLARYAGADLAAPEHRARAISTVVWATTIGAVAGPNALAPAGRLADWCGLPTLAGPFVVALVWFAAAAAVVGLRLRPDPLVVAGGLETAEASESRRSAVAQLRVVLSDRSAGAGLVAMVAATGVMVAVMTMTPLHLRDHGGSLEMVGLVMSVHVAGMYAFAPLVGSIADRRGALPTAYAATAMLVASCMLAAVPGHNHVVIGVALTMLGLGWSMAMISGAVLVIAGVPPEERARTQGVADMTMGIAGGAGGTVSGIVVGSVGYPTLSLTGAVLAGAVLVALLRQRDGHPPPSSAGAALGPEKASRSSNPGWRADARRRRT
jgi:MFS family permease